MAVRHRRLLVASVSLSTLVASCGTSDSAPNTSPSPVAPVASVQRVRVTLDGAPAVGAAVSQGGVDRRVLTDERGDADVPLDDAVLGEHWVVASLPTARARAARVDPAQRVEIDLRAFAVTDDPTYTFEPPGRSDVPGTAAECAHCHSRISEGFERSPHAGAASNPRVHDLYAGTAAARADAAACAEVGGELLSGRVPGADGAAVRCYVGDSALARANPSCASPPCDVAASSFAGCADCHAPGIDGPLGGRDLLEARGDAYSSGVHCDVCHKVEGIRDVAAPGVAGRLRILRPSEPGRGPGGRLPLTFGPFGDVGLPRMGSVARSLFVDGGLCTGCHEQTVTAPPSPRAPGGALPVDTTTSEWRQGPMSGVPCQSCHGARLGVANAAAVGLHAHDADLASGWPRPPGAVHDHRFAGPRGDRDLAALALSLELSTRLVGDTLEVDATVTNRGAGHALPTGEAMRAMFLLVDARCGDARLTPIGGDVVPEVGGALERRAAGDDWTRWPGALVGQELRVVTRDGAFRDYDGPGVFTLGGLPASEKGLPLESLAGVRTIVAVAADGAVTLDAPLPAGDVVVRGDPPWSAPGARASRVAFTPGFAFARVLVDGSGRAQVPHFAARDALFDDRLPPGRAAKTRHRFRASCATPTATARLVHRPFPAWLSDERSWTPRDRVLVEVTR